MSRWFRMYADVLDDPKVQKLPPDLFKAWVNILCLASRNDGVLPDIEDIAFALRMSQPVTRDIVVTLTGHGLIDECDGLSPHNWAERQFKSDTPEDARERKRKQRAREKQAPKADNVTECHSDSHNEVTPPEQSRTDHIRTEQNTPQADVVCEPEHRKIVQDILDHHDDLLDQWKREFLINIKWRPSLTKVQRNSLDAIVEMVNPQFGKDKPMQAVTRGTPQFDAWLQFYKKRDGSAKFYESRDSLTVPTEYPPQEQAA